MSNKKMEEQIFEMAHHLCCQNNCAECDSDYRCEFIIESSILHKAGYRKQSEFAREIFEEIERTLKSELPFIGSAVVVMLAGLKKKYTEGEDDRNSEG